MNATRLGASRGTSGHARHVRQAQLVQKVVDTWDEEVFEASQRGKKDDSDEASSPDGKVRLTKAGHLMAPSRLKSCLSLSLQDVFVKDLKMTYKRREPRSL